ncbi:hypothetical protein AVEN_151677-1 [Araneus ventricosus]|uniref:Uncharacterized protein n=1 Tax=Araneus ventricosus TaxID=182803 RepID=A0A4Y2UNP8_ARAVE|nr:hypothetical protein AVEN_151677-1 [Araneus ventricosus]
MVGEGLQKVSGSRVTRTIAIARSEDASRKGHLVRSDECVKALRRPAKKVSASEPEESRFETRFHQSSECILAWLTPGLMSKIKRLPAAVEGMFVDGGQAEVSSSSCDQGSNLRSTFGNSSRVLSKPDSNITKLNVAPFNKMIYLTTYRCMNSCSKVS